VKQHELAGTSPESLSIKRTSALLHKDQPSGTRVQEVAMFWATINKGNPALESHDDQKNDVRRLLEEYNPIIYKPAK